MLKACSLLTLALLLVSNSLIWSCQQTSVHQNTQRAARARTFVKWLQPFLTPPPQPTPVPEPPPAPMPRPRTPDPDIEPGPEPDPE